MATPGVHTDSDKCSLHCDVWTECQRVSAFTLHLKWIICCIQISIFYTVKWDEIMLVQCYRQWYVAGNDGRISVEGKLKCHKNPKVYTWMTNNRNTCIYTTKVVLTVPICCFIFQANYLYIFQLFILFLTIMQYNFFSKRGQKC